MVQVQHVSPLAVINIERENEGNRIWRNIRQRGDLTCHGVSIPKKCSNGICDNYPEVKLCTTCKRCPCDYLLYFILLSFKQNIYFEYSNLHTILFLGLLLVKQLIILDKSSLQGFCE